MHAASCCSLCCDEIILFHHKKKLISSAQLQSLDDPQCKSLTKPLTFLQTHKVNYCFVFLPTFILHCAPDPGGSQQ